MPNTLVAIVISLLAGTLLPLSLAPFNFWWLGIVSIAALAFLLQRAEQHHAFVLGWAHSSGAFLVGVSWIYIAIHDFGYHSAAFSALLTALFCLAMGTLNGLMAHCYCRWLRGGLGAALTGFAALWVLFEWLRSWLFTGFPWLLAGYSQFETVVSGWAPVTGIFGLSFWVALAAAALAMLVSDWRRGISALLAVSTLAGLGYSLQQQHWTQAVDRPPLTVGLVQSNISQDKKWREDQYWATLEFYDQAAVALWPSTDLVIWPEAAIPTLYHQALPYFDYIRQQASQVNGALISGVPTRNGDDMYNSVMVIAGGQGIYNKQRLVPFGEYVPFRQWLGPMISLFDLPLSSFSLGQSEQSHLRVKGWELAASICYEVVYPDLIARSSRGADVLFTISNDSWFGDSLGPAQHMQMARMRALENGRELIRVTSTGITGVVDHRGEVRERLPSFTQASLVTKVHARSGATPFSRSGSTPILLLCALLVLTALISQRRRRS